MTGKQLLTILGGVAGVMVAISTMHTTYILPSILKHVETECVHRIEAHDEHPHNSTKVILDSLDERVDEVLLQQALIQHAIQDVSEKIGD